MFPAAMIRAILVISSTLAFAAAVACSSSNSGKADAAVDAFSSTCGHPGDMGNDQGVGKFCQSQSDCSGTPNASLCSVIGDATTHFCTHICTSGGSADQCGSDAMCTCNSSNQCGCTPNACLTGP
jgi:hypothetical protein